MTMRKHSWLGLCKPALLIATALALAALSPVGRPQMPTTNTGDDVLAHLNAAISWYKNLTAKVPAGPEPSDAIYLNNAQNFGAQVVRLAFQSAKAQADLDSQPAGPANTGTGQDSSNSVPTGAQKYVKMENDVSQRISDDETQLAALKQKDGRMKQSDLLAQQRSLEGKLALDKASLSAVQQIRNFVENSNSGETGLKGSIHQLARSVPEVLETQTIDKPGTSAAPAAKSSTATTRPGLFGQLVTLYGEMQSIRSIDQRMDEADDLRRIATSLRVPLRNELTSTLQQEKELGANAGVTKEQYDGLTARFKGISAALLPLSEELVVLDQSQANLSQWKKAHTDESRTILISILSRIALIAISIALVLGLAELWRRLTFRYIHDPRRRRQFLILRRVVMGFLIFLVLIMGFASEFSSLATFAGFVTAGIAVGLQTILLSVAAYFFVIGRYGISVGDRISVAGVTGDVIDVGLVRFYLMEFASTGTDLYPTGRIVVFSNAVLFQATTPLFKQLPGTRYTWHEAVLPLAAKTDYGAAERAVDAAVSPVYKEYQLDSLGHRRAFDSIDIAISPPTPHHRLQFGESGPELVARYPVDLSKSAEIDNKITRALIGAIQSDHQLAAAVIGSPKIRAPIKN